MKITKRQLRRIIREASTGQGSESPADMAKEVVQALKRRSGSGAELVGDDEIYIMTGKAEGVTVKVVGRGRPRGLNDQIDQDKYSVFADEINRGMGWIADWDVKRQWEGMFDQELSPKAVDYLVAALEVNGLLGEDDKEYGE
jgi:hypothetical protein